MTWWLNVFFLANGLWIPGAELPHPGWSARAYGSHAECLARKAFAEEACARDPLPLESLWICSPGAPLEAVPDAMLANPT